MWMRQQSDIELLRRYALQGLEAAFGELVARHTDLVYSAAVHQLDPELARDVAQSVLLTLLEKPVH